MLTTKEFAQEVNAPYTTVMGWLKDGRIPEARFDDTNPRGGVWFIPRSAVARFVSPETRPQKGRPAKPTPEDEKKTSKASKKKGKAK